MLTVLQPGPVPPPGTQSPNWATVWSEPLVSPPLPTHLKTRIVATAPPLVKVPRARMSPTWCWPLKVPARGPVVIAPTGPLKNQKPKSLDPLVAQRSAPKYSVWRVPVSYLIAKASRI